MLIYTAGGLLFAILVANFYHEKNGNLKQAGFNSGHVINQRVM